MEETHLSLGLPRTYAYPKWLKDTCPLERVEKECWEKIQHTHRSISGIAVGLCGGLSLWIVIILIGMLVY